MIKRFSILTILFFLVFIQVNSQNTLLNQALKEEVRKFGQAKVMIPYPGREAIERISDFVSISSVRDNNVTISLSPLTVDWFIAHNLTYKLVERPDYKGIITAEDKGQATDWQTYPSYTDYVAIMQDFATNYPSICDIDTIGTTIYGKLVLVLKISDNVKIKENEPEVFYTSTMHGDETGGFILMLRLADSLLKGYSKSLRIKNMVDNLEIWINPLANPDGTYHTGNVISSPVRENASGVDLNRNFPDPTQPFKTYEKETIDMVSFMRKHHFVISANFHSGAEVLNYPWDKWDELHADDAWFNQICRAYADTVHLYSQTGYLNDFSNGVVRGSVWYSINGGRQDFVTYELQGREVTMEIDDDWVTPATQLQLLWLYNKRSLLGYLENALYGIHGFVKDASSSLPVPARIFISGHDRDSSHIYSDTITGSFTRLLFPGTWNLNFSAHGYQDTTVNNITVTAGQKTDLLVFMNPLTTEIDTNDPEVPLLYPNPASSFIYCRLPEKMAGNLTIMIFGWDGKKYASFSTQCMPHTPVEIDIQDLPAGTFFVSFRNIATGLSCHGRFVTTKHSL